MTLADSFRRSCFPSKIENSHKLCHSNVLWTLHDCYVRCAPTRQGTAQRQCYCGVYWTEAERVHVGITQSLAFTDDYLILYQIHVYDTYHCCSQFQFGVGAVGYTAMRPSSNAGTIQDIFTWIYCLYRQIEKKPYNRVLLSFVSTDVCILTLSMPKRDNIFDCMKRVQCKGHTEILEVCTGLNSHQNGNRL